MTFYKVEHCTIRADEHYFSLNSALVSMKKKTPLKIFMFSKSVIHSEFNTVFTFINDKNLMLLNSLIVCNKNESNSNQCHVPCVVIFIHLVFNDK